MKKILVFGASGMAGHMITMYLENKSNKYEVYNVCFRTPLNKKSKICDVSDIKNVEKLINSFLPDIIINCVGVLNKTANLDVKNTIYVNSFFPKLLERLGAEKAIKIIHISTDCVFKGIDGGYNEDSYKDETNIYGLSKSLGEIKNDKDLTFRTSIIGPELKNGSGLFHWFMEQGGYIKGYSEAVWTGVTTLELAKAIDKAIDCNLTGLYHLVNNEKINKYELIKIFNKYFKDNNIIIEKDKSYICDKSLINTRTDFDFKINDYDSMIRDLKLWINKYEEVYKLYK